MLAKPETPGKSWGRILRKFALQTAAVLLALFAAIWIAILIIKPGPEGKIIMASGGAGGLYNDLAKTYQKELARFGVKLELRPDVQGIEALKGLFPQYKSEFKSYDPNNMDLQAAILKGGFSGTLRGKLATEQEQKWHTRQVENLASVGRLFYEPVWVFQTGEPIKSLRQLKGKKIYVGDKASGARRVAAYLLKANGVDEKNSTLIDEDLPEDGAPLIDGKADAAIMILPAESKLVQTLLRNKRVRLMDFSAEAEAYTNRFPALSKVILRQGAVEFDPDTPPADVTLISTSAALVIRKDLHPALISLLTYAVEHNPKIGFDKAGDPILFYHPGEFPSGKDPEFDVPQEAQTVYKSSELPLILRGMARLTADFNLPFWPAAIVSQYATSSILLLIPLLSIIFPLIRILPVLYSWTVRRRLLYWYRQLKALEDSMQDAPTPGHLEEKQAELDRIDRAVSKIRVPINFSNQLYDLRGHIDLVRQRLLPKTRTPAFAAE